MYVDAELSVSTAQALTTTAVSTNVIDLSQQRDIGEGKKLIMAFSINTAFTGGTSIQFQIIGSAASTMTSPAVIGQSDVLPIADPRVAAGMMVYVDFNSLYKSLGYRYVAANYNIVGTMTAGAVTANIVETVEDFKVYPSGFSVV